MLLSLVVIFTQSIQLSKIMKRTVLLRCRIAPLGGSSIPAQGSTSLFLFKELRLNLKQTSLGETLIEWNGGAERDRTVDPLLAKQVLSQLSYSPSCFADVSGGSGWIRTIDPRLIKTVL